MRPSPVAATDMRGRGTLRPAVSRCAKRTPRAGKRSEAERGEKQSSGAQRNPILFGGQYTKKTSPIRFFRGTEPHERESQELARLSPMKK